MGMQSANFYFISLLKVVPLAYEGVLMTVAGCDLNSVEQRIEIDNQGQA